MPVWGALGGTLLWNYVRHLQGKSTLCSHGRKHLSNKQFLAGWAALTVWLIQHFCKR